MRIPLLEGLVTLLVGSLFSGIGGFDLGLERAGMRVAWQCEADDFCRRVLAHHWPDVPCYPDVRELAAANVEPVDVLCGGFPCQDISVAGRGAGIDGERSGLWTEYTRLVRELRPRYVVVENVAALLGRGLERVLGDLASCGYDAEWDCIPASAVGAPHRRDRIWIVAYPQCERWEGEPHVVRQGDSDWRASFGGEGAGQPARRDQAARTVAHTDDGHGQPGPIAGPAVRGEARGQAADGDARGAGADLAGWWAVEPDVGRVAHGVPARMDRLHALGNALVPQIAEWLGRRILDYEDYFVTELVA